MTPQFSLECPPKPVHVPAWPPNFPLSAPPNQYMYLHDSPIFPWVPPQTSTCTCMTPQFSLECPPKPVHVPACPPNFPLSAPQTSTCTCMTPFPPQFFVMAPLLARKFLDGPSTHKKQMVPKLAGARFAILDIHAWGYSSILAMWVCAAVPCTVCRPLVRNRAHKSRV